MSTLPNCYRCKESPCRCADGVTLLQGDCLSVMPELPEKHFHCCVTSPPYWGLRDYGTATWAGGDAECDHLEPPKHGYDAKGASTLGPKRDGLTEDNAAFSTQVKRQQHKGLCAKCGATRIDAQLGLEPTPEAYVATMVEVFRGVWRVLRDDGVLFLNLGSSYSSGKSGMTNIPNLLQGICKHGIVCIAGGGSLAISTKGHDVLAEHELTPDCELVPLLGVKRVFIKQGNNNLRQILDGVKPECGLWITPIASRFVVENSAPDIVLDIPEGVRVVCSQIDLDAKSSLDVFSSGAHENDEATFPVKEATEPCAKVGSWKSRGDSVSLDTTTKGSLDVNAMDQAVAFGDSLGTCIHLGGDFVVTEASLQQAAFLSVDGGVEVRVGTIGHVLLHDGDGFTQYASLYAKATRQARARQHKQELGIPEMVCRALMEDGWICRDRIVWHKPSPMPGSQRDRCTSSYEMVFQLTKQPTYYWDMSAVREEATHPVGTGVGWNRTRENAPGDTRDNGDRHKDELRDCGTRIPRNVQQTEWTQEDVEALLGYLNAGPSVPNILKIASEGFPGAHFATFPRALPEWCIRAATSLKGCCPECGTPWVRLTESERVRTRPGEHSKSYDKTTGEVVDDGMEKPWRDRAEIGNRDPGRHVTATRTVGWRRDCKCGVEHGEPEYSPVPCRVLDLFGGAGTSALAAIGLQRHCTLIELAEDYCDQIVKRLRDGLYATGTKRNDCKGQQTMFGG